MLHFSIRSNRVLIFVLKFVFLCILILNSDNNAFAKVCNDCQEYSSCPAAYELMGDNIDIKSELQIKATYCGVGYNDDGDRIYKVCCSDFDGGNLELHPNYYLLPRTCGYVDVYPTDSVSLYEFPWIALINTTYPLLLFPCDGVIINSKYILTTAFCASKYQPILVRVGEFNPETDVDCIPTNPQACEGYKQDILIDEIVLHPNASLIVPDMRNNIALIRLKNEIDFSHRNTAPVCLPVSNNNRIGFKTGKFGMVAGWKFSNGSRHFSTFLKQRSEIQDNSICKRQLFANRPDITLENYLCIRKVFKNTQICNGLSGDAFIAVDLYNGIPRYIAYGLYSHGPALCVDLPDVFIDVSKYMKWILDNLKP